MKIAIIGYKGKTGSKVYELLKEHKFDVIGIDKEDVLIKEIDLLIDFTNKNSSLKHIDFCFINKINFIIGTTGFLKHELIKIKKQCKENNIKGIICYNFSLPINFILNNMCFFKNYFDKTSYLDIHHISKLDQISGTTRLFLQKNNKISVKSAKTNKNTISYVIQMETKYDKMNITYQVNDKKVFALGILYYLKTNDESYISNLIG